MCQVVVSRKQTFVSLVDQNYNAERVSGSNFSKPSNYDQLVDAWGSKKLTF